jgi:hypothetical protein
MAESLRSEALALPICLGVATEERIRTKYNPRISESYRRANYLSYCMVAVRAGYDVYPDFLRVSGVILR